jgi:hypothetical protein
MPFEIGPPCRSKSEIDIIKQYIRDGTRDASGNPAPATIGRSVRLRGRLDNAGRLDGLARCQDLRLISRSESK